MTTYSQHHTTWGKLKASPLRNKTRVPSFPTLIQYSA
jgi:hypothetical protein